MLIAVATQFKLSRITKYPSFAWLTWKVFRQARRSEGLVMVRIKPIALRTLTVWKSRGEMIAFRNRGVHLHAMRKAHTFGDTGSVTWEVDHIPNWAEAQQKLQETAVSS